jgi:hypothetical protein
MLVLTPSASMRWMPPSGLSRLKKLSGMSASDVNASPDYIRTRTHKSPLAGGAT